MKKNKNKEKKQKKPLRPDAYQLEPKKLDKLYTRALKRADKFGRYLTLFGDAVRGPRVQIGPGENPPVGMAKYYSADEIARLVKRWEKMIVALEAVESAIEEICYLPGTEFLEFPVVLRRSRSAAAITAKKKTGIWEVR